MYRLSGRKFRKCEKCWMKIALRSVSLTAFYFIVLLNEGGPRSQRGKNYFIFLGGSKEDTFSRLSSTSFSHSLSLAEFPRYISCTSSILRWRDSISCFEWLWCWSDEIWGVTLPGTCNSVDDNRQPEFSFANTDATSSSCEYDRWIIS